MKVKVKDLLVNRSILTRQFKISGIPVIQMSTHVPILQDYITNLNYVKSYDTLFYSMLEGVHTHDSLIELFRSIKQNGILNPIVGTNLGEKTELLGGHHRAVIASILGIEEIEIIEEPLNYIDNLKSHDILVAYKKVYDSEVLTSGMSYNYCPGLRHIRGSKDRLNMIYSDIIDCNGDNLVDLGCNDGYFGVALSQHDFKVTFVDRSMVYLEVVQAKMKLLKTPAKFLLDDVTENNYIADVTIYMDVFYHTVLERGIEVAYNCLRKILENTNERLIFSPGRWDKLYLAGCTQKDVFKILIEKSKKIKYLGKDNDKGYGREIYSIYL